MRVARPLLALALILGLAVAVWYFAPDSLAQLAPVAKPATQPGPITMPADAQPATVNYVHDGDTIFIATPADSNLKVRLLAVDTPEVGDNLECYGDEATAYVRGLLPEGSTIYTTADVEPTDQYGRSLLFIWTATGTLVNLDLVEQGYAEAVFIGQNRLYEDQVEAAEDAAQGAGRGIWGNC